MLQEKLIDLNKKLIYQASLVEKMIENCIKGLKEKNKEKLEQVLHEDEDQVNSLEIEIEQAVTSSIASFQPVAKDLRILLMSLRMTNDLERMGDLSVNIAESALYLIQKPPFPEIPDLEEIEQTTKEMVKNSIDAVVTENEELARQVLLKDDVVDDLHNQIREDLILFMKDDPDYVKRALHFLRISNNLERIADHSTNICEEALFIKDAKVVKHHQEELDQA